MNKGISETKKREFETRQSGGDGADGEPLAADNLRSIRSEKFYKFPSNKISAERLSSSQPLNCRDLIGHHGKGSIDVVEFSDDGSLFASGGEDGRVLLWPTNKAIDLEWIPEPTAMETVVTADEEVYPSVLCLTVSPDNQRIFSGSRDNNLLIHDSIT